MRKRLKTVRAWLRGLIDDPGEAATVLKIGYAKDPERRIKELQTGSPNELRFALVIPGSIQTEKELHDLFADQRRQGEWFELNSRLISHVNELAHRTRYPGIKITTR